MKLSLTLLIFIYLLINSSSVFACSCIGHPTACAAYHGARAVFIGTVQNVQNQKITAKDGNEYIGGQVARVQVEKAFKGMKETEVIFRSWGSSCDVVYREGDRWLFYAYYSEKTNSWEIGDCGRSKLIESAAEDLLYLQGLPASAERTRISGTLAHYENDPVKGFTRVRNIIGAKVRLIGAQKTYEVFTDKNGVYEIYDVPAGKYVVDPEVPHGLKLRFPIYHGKGDRTNLTTLRLVVEEKSCGSVDFVFSANTMIHGKLFGADGLAMRNVCLSLMPKDQPTRSNWIFDCTDEQGNYELNEIPPGEYLIVVNADGKISSNEPFSTTYYPGVFDKKKATVLAITDGANLEDYDIHIPSQETRRLIQGVLLFSDGRPVAKEFVEFRADAVKEGYDGEVHTSTDDQGRFSLSVLEGLKGSLRGFMYTYVGEFENCPQLDELIKAKGGNVPDLGTTPIMLEIDRDLQDIKLSFPFPYCTKATPK